MTKVLHSRYLCQEFKHIIMKKVVHKAEERGFQNHGWLIANHSFSFANYYDPDKVHFGVLRVLNDDFVAAGMGFGMHPHANMEIITIPLSGELHHKDSMGNFGAIQKGEIQVMSAGTGIQHSEFNGSETAPVTLLQIWVIPKEMNVTPRYDQIKIADQAVENEFQQIISPNPNDAGSWIHQDAWFHLGHFSQEKQEAYTFRKQGNGLYLFVISGTVTVGNTTLGARDAIGIWETDKVDLQIGEASEVLLMEIPMDLPKM